VRATVAYNEAPTGDIAAIDRHVIRADYIRGRSASTARGVKRRLTAPRSRV